LRFGWQDEGHVKQLKVNAAAFFTNEIGYADGGGAEAYR
jgi:hypothetical protein